MLGRFGKGSADSRLQEEKLYEQVVQELREGKRRDGLWGKALADGGGNEETSKALYIRYRVQSIIDDIQLGDQAGRARKSIPKKSGTILTNDPEYVLCATCQFEQWKGYNVCQKCGVRFSA